MKRSLIEFKDGLHGAGSTRYREWKAEIKQKNLPPISKAASEVTPKFHRVVRFPLRRETLRRNLESLYLVERYRHYP